MKRATTKLRKTDPLLARSALAIETRATRHALTRGAATGETATVSGTQCRILDAKLARLATIEQALHRGDIQTAMAIANTDLL